jgi:hypothetical protein
MSKTEEEILRAALSLREEARAEIADKLLRSLEPEPDDTDERWAWEAEDRIAAFERGELSAIPGDEVFSSLKLRRGA